MHRCYVCTHLCMRMYVSCMCPACVHGCSVFPYIQDTCFPSQICTCRASHTHTHKDAYINTYIYTQIRTCYEPAGRSSIASQNTTSHTCTKMHIHKHIHIHTDSHMLRACRALPSTSELRRRRRCVVMWRTKESNLVPPLPA